MRGVQRYANKNNLLGVDDLASFGDLLRFSMADSLSFGLASVQSFSLSFETFPMITVLANSSSACTGAGEASTQR